ncbi:MAG: chemotaxis protein CheW [Myxococcaceae bacterium]|nr:chemotaxis protein CheW [Myxococcaceae bacterium]
MSQTFTDPSDPARLAKYVDEVSPPAHTPAEPPQARLTLVSFAVATELFALPVERVREVVRAHGISRVPGSPDHVRGVQSLRGRMIAVLDARTRLGLPPADITPASRVLIVEGRGRLLGLLVDEVRQVGAVLQKDFAPPPAEIRSQLTEHVRGMVPLDGRLALVLDLERLLLLPQASQETP